MTISDDATRLDGVIGRLQTSVAAQINAGNRRIILAGAGGWLGLATLELLADALGSAFADRVVCFGSSERRLSLRDGRAVQQYPLAQMAALERRPSLLLHYAFLTKDRAEIMAEAEYRSANAAIRDRVLASLDRIGVEALFLASSGAAARADDPHASPAMRLYGELKRADEEVFGDWARSADGRRAAICRIYNLTGPYINKHGAYAMASFILDALAGRRIAVRAPRPVVRANVAIRELLSLVLAALADGGEGVLQFDSGGVPLELGDIAAMVAQCLGSPGVDRAAIDELRPDAYFGDADSYNDLLDRYQIDEVDLTTQIIETADYMRSIVTTQDL